MHDSTLNRLVAALVFCAAASSGAPAPLIADETELEPHAARESVLVPFIENYCLDCHSEGYAEAGLELDVLAAADSIQRHRREWAHVIERLRQGEMPPEDAYQPETDERAAVADWLQTELDALDCSPPLNPGKVTVRRLNRNEYANTIRDWLGVVYDPTNEFPRDELGYGFDNIGDVLSMTPLLLEKYLDAAEQISERAIVTPESIVEPAVVIHADQLEGGSLTDDRRRLLATNGAASATFHCEAAGRYLLRVQVYATQAGDEPTLMQIAAGDQSLKLVPVEAERGDPQTFVASLQCQPGDIEVSAALVNDLWQPWDEDPSRRDRNLYIDSLTLVGPLSVLEPSNLPDSHRRLLPEAVSQSQWSTDNQWRDAICAALRNWTRRAFRRPPTELEIERLAEIVDATRRRGDSFERSMQLALQAVLISPNFLFRGEPASGNHEGIRPLNDFELAARMSYFLWNSLPDEPLMELAAAGELRDQLDAEIDRMIADPKSERLINSFGQQWLETRNLESLPRVDALFPDYDDQLRQAFRQETIFFLRDMWRNDAPLPTLLSADYSFVNARLAKHYGAPPPDGDGFHKVTMPPQRQLGLLGHAGVLAVTSYADRTSPVIRGKWILERLLNDPPPPPPPDVPELKRASRRTRGTLRQRLEQHRADPMCAACHKRMDPLGFALENFDAIGRWRDEENKKKIDPSGELPDGRKIDGPAGLRDVLLEDFDRVRRALAEQMLTYALGRGLEYYDQCTVNQIVESTVADGDTFAAMARAIIHSPAFLQRNEAQE